MNIPEFEAHIKTLSRAELVDMYYKNLQSIGLTLLRHKDQMRQKPLLGGAFGHGAFVLASKVDFATLHIVTYYVLEKDSRMVLGTGDTKAEALEHARLFLVQPEQALRLQSEFVAFKVAAQQQIEADAEKRQAEWEAHRDKIRASQPIPIKTIPRRRKRIFEESGGKCHYCETPITLDGRWHIEHKFPKALGGTDEPNNLVAACPTCNHEKIDTTDIEYKAKRAARKSA